MREQPVSLGYIKDTNIADPRTTTNAISKSNQLPPLPQSQSQQDQPAPSHSQPPLFHRKNSAKRLLASGSSEDLVQLTQAPAAKRVASLEELLHVNGPEGQDRRQSHQQQQRQEKQSRGGEQGEDPMDVDQRESDDALAQAPDGEEDDGGRGPETPGIARVGTALAGLRLAGLGGVANRGLSLDSPRSARLDSPALADPDLAELAACGVVGITPAALMSGLNQPLRSQTEQMDVLEEQDEDEDPVDKLPFPKSTPILAVDLRDVADFARARIQGSVNLNLPMLVLKRFRRGAVASFQLTNFLTDIDSKRAFHSWAGNTAEEEPLGSTREESEEELPPVDPAADRAIVIYDEEMNETHRDTEAWALVNILAKGLADDVWSSNARRSPTAAPAGHTFVAYLRGGYRAFREHPGANSYMFPHDAFSDCSPSTASPAPTSTHAPSPGFSIRTSRLMGSDSGNGGASTPLTAEPPSTPTHARVAAALADGAGRQRKKSAFSINTTKLAPAQRARGATLGAAGMQQQLPRRMTVVTAGGGGAPPMSARPGMDTHNILTSNNPPPSAFPGRGRQPFFQDDNQQVQTPVTMTHPDPYHPRSRRRSISEPRGPIDPSAQQNNTQSISPTTQQHPHSAAETAAATQMMMLSPGPSTLPTPAEPVSLILPHLLLGSDAIPQAKDGVDQLLAMGVTHVLNMAVEVENVAVDASGKFKTKWCLAEDHAEHDMEPAIKEAVDWIGEFLCSETCFAPAPPLTLN
ncbi:hypothetical protein HKX48_002145 [Thoreauomyces humboldtii]|nr:hypothetical protein HKX48_002145 [Thoreauomyces humboldtii]